MILVYFIIAVLTGLAVWLGAVVRARYQASDFLGWVLSLSACSFVLIIDLMFCLGVWLS
ncbi:hypothetical protein ACVTMO_16665 [Pseudomonas segetis]